MWVSHVWLFVTPGTVTCQASLSMEFPRQVYWSGLSFPSPGDLLKPGIEAMSLESPALAEGFFTSWATGEDRLWFTVQIALFLEGICAACYREKMEDWTPQTACEIRVLDLLSPEFDKHFALSSRPSFHVNRQHRFPQETEPFQSPPVLRLGSCGSI